MSYNDEWACDWLSLHSEFVHDVNNGPGSCPSLLLLPFTLHPFFSFTVFNISVSHFLVFRALTHIFVLFFSPSSRKITMLVAAYHLHPFVFTWFLSFFSSLISPPLLPHCLSIALVPTQISSSVSFFSLTFHLFSPGPSLALFLEHSLARILLNWSFSTVFDRIDPLYRYCFVNFFSFLCVALFSWCL